MLELDLKNIPVSDLENNLRLYASKFTMDELLYVFGLCNDDNDRKNAIIKILEIKWEMSRDISDSEMSLNWLLNKFFSGNSSIKDGLLSEGVKDEDLESRFKLALLKFCTFVVEQTPLTDEMISFAGEFGIDLDNVYFLNKLKNDLIVEFGYFYDVKNHKFVILSESYKLDFWRWKIRFNELVEKRLEHSDRFVWKNVLSWCSAYWDTVNYNFFWDDVVLYESGDDYIPIDNFCSFDLTSWCSIDTDLSYDNDLSDLVIDDLEEMYNNGERFMVVKPTYKMNISDEKENPNYCRFVDIYAINAKKRYRVLSW